VADVAANSQGEVTTNGACVYYEFSSCMVIAIIIKHTGGRLKRFGSTEHGTTSLDSIKTLPDHTDNRTRGHVGYKAREEGLVAEISVIYSSR
jgi:hypothetical protein